MARLHTQRPGTQSFDTLALTVGLALVLLIALLPTRSLIAPSDHQGYLDYVSDARGMSGLSGYGGKEWVGFIFYNLDRIAPFWVITNAMFFIYLFLVCSNIRSFAEVAIFYVLSVPMFVYFGYITKESIMMMILLGTAFTWLRFGERPATIVFIALFSLFAIAIRPYYAVPIVLALASLRYDWKRIATVAACVVPFVIAFWSAPFQMTEQARLMMFYKNEYVWGSRTVFPFLFTDNDIPAQLRALGNYCLSLIYVSTPLVWSQTLKEIFAQLHFVFLVIVTVQALRYGKRLLTYFGIGILIMLPLFIPDLGTWVRHSSAVCFFFFLAIYLARREQQSRGVFLRRGFRLSLATPIWGRVG